MLGDDKGIYDKESKGRLIERLHPVKGLVLRLNQGVFVKIFKFKKSVGKVNDILWASVFSLVKWGNNTCVVYIRGLV